MPYRVSLNVMLCCMTSGKILSKLMVVARSKEKHIYSQLGTFSVQYAHAFPHIVDR